MSTLKRLLPALFPVVAFFAAADAVPLRGVAWQWCFELPDAEFRMATLEAQSRAGLNVIMPEFGPLFNESGDGNSLGRAELCAFLSRAKELDLTVIPLVNTLDHGERSPDWPERLAGGFDLGSERNYRYLFDHLDAWRGEFAAAGLAMPYLHLGMDEASAVLLANAEKYGRSTGELLQAHILRLLGYCREHGVRMIVWHDTLMSSDDPLYDGDMNYEHSDRAGAWPIRRDLPRDLILMYWNYEAREGYAVVDGLIAEGFEVWLMPWGSESVRAMSAYALAREIPAVIASTWMESGFYPDRAPGDNAMPKHRWVMEAIAETARCTRGRPAGEGGDPGLAFVRWYFPPPATALPVWNRERLTLGTPAGDIGEWLAEAVPPFSILRDGVAVAEIDGVDRERGENETILYTSRAGKSTGTNGFGAELTLAGGRVVARTTWGVGDSPLRRGHCVVSGHGAASGNLEAIPLGAELILTDTAGKRYGGVDPAGKDAVRIRLGGAAEYIELLWGSEQATCIDGAVLGELRLCYEDGTEVVREFCYGRDFYARELPGFYWGRSKEVQVWPEDGFTGWRWRQPYPEKSLAALEVTLNAAGNGLGLEIVRIAAGSENDGVAAYWREETRADGPEPAFIRDSGLAPGGYRIASGAVYGGDLEGMYNGVEALLTGGGQAGTPDLPVRAVDFQWCYQPVSLETMLDTVRTMRRLKLNYIVPEFGPMARWDRSDSPVPHGELRRFLAECRRACLMVIPKSNAFGHSDRGFPWPAPLGDGLDLGETVNYQALEEEVRRWRDELARAGLPMPYFHFGMDEASDCLAKNLEKYGGAAARLVAEHMNRIAAICREVGTTGIVYHDMLVGSAEDIYWRDMGTPHADANGSYRARPLVDKGLVIDYWNYEGFDRYRTLEALKKEGFRVFLSPWGGSSVRKMAKNARLYGEGLIGTTWCDFSAFSGNSIFNQAWIRDGLVDLALYGWDCSGADIPRPPDGGWRWIDHFRDRPTRRGGAEPLWPGERTLECKGVTFAMGAPLLLGDGPKEGYDAAFAALVEGARLPLYLYLDGRECARIDAVNRPAAFTGLTLYTRFRGRETGVDIYSTEARIQDGIVFSKNDWGVGHTLIPRNGAVISGWGEGNYGLPELPVGGKLELRDSSGRTIPWRAEDAVERHPEEASLELPEDTAVIHLLHQTAFEGGLECPPVVEAVIEYAGGSSEDRVFRYGIHLAALDDPMLVAADTPDIWAATPGRYVCSWECRPGAARLLLRLTPEGRPLGYRLEAVSVERRR